MMSHQDPYEIIKAHQASCPIPIMSLARAFGLRVYEEDGWPNDVSGLIERAEPEDDAASGYRIIVNSRHSRERKRFTIAHEIAHYVLHRDQIGDRLQDNAFYRSSRLSGRVEAEANRLAADILMPFPLIEQLRREGATSVEELARRFEVSKVAMAIRLGLPTD
jgi:predicted transcriptional regulator